MRSSIRCRKEALLRQGFGGHASQAFTQRSMVRLEGIEPSIPLWKSGVLPLNYSRETSAALRERRRGQASAKTAITGPAFHQLISIKTLPLLSLSSNG
jgi:hypothetical protein